MLAYLRLAPAHIGRDESLQQAEVAFADSLASGLVEGADEAAERTRRLSAIGAPFRSGIREFGATVEALERPSFRLDRIVLY